MKTLLANGADANSKGVGGNRPLHAAAKTGDAKILKALLDHGADVNARDKEGQTVLHAAALYQVMPMIEVLLAHGADVNAEDKTGGTPADLACVGQSSEALKRLLAAGAKVKNASGAYQRAITTGSLEMVQLLAGSGVPLEGTNALSAAAGGPYEEIGLYLLSKGAKADEVYANERRPIHYAAMAGHARLIAALLVKAGADSAAARKIVEENRNEEFRSKALAALGG